MQDSGIVLIMTSGLTASEFGPGYYYDNGSGKGQHGSKSDKCTLQTSTGDWVHRRLDVGDDNDGRKSNVSVFTKYVVNKLMSSN